MSTRTEELIQLARHFTIDDATGDITNSGKLTTDDATDATTTTDGSIQTDGGLSVVKKAVIGDDLSVGGDSTLIGSVAVSDTTSSTDKDTGALVIEGGVGIEENLNVGGDSALAGSLTINDTTTSTTKDTGALVIEGGVGIEENLNVGGDTALDGSVIINDSGADVDFRVEGVGEANALFVQGSDGFVGINKVVPETQLDVVGSVQATMFQGIYTGSSTLTANVASTLLDLSGILNADEMGLVVIDRAGAGSGCVVLIQCDANGSGYGAFMINKVDVNAQPGANYYTAATVSGAALQINQNLGTGTYQWRVTKINGA